MIKLIKESTEDFSGAFKEAVASCEGSIYGLAFELWRRYVPLEDAISLTISYYESGRARGLLRRDIKECIEDGDLEQCMAEEYEYQNQNYDRMKKYFGRV